MAAQRPPTGGCQGSGAARVDFLSACRGAGVYRRPVKGARRPGTRRLRPTTPTPAPVDLCALARAGLWTRSARAPAGPPDLRPGGGAARSSPETPRARPPPRVASARRQKVVRRGSAAPAGHPYGGWEAVLTDGTQKMSGRPASARGAAGVPKGPGRKDLPGASCPAGARRLWPLTAERSPQGSNAADDRGVAPRTAPDRPVEPARSACPVDRGAGDPPEPRRLGLPGLGGIRLAVTGSAAGAARWRPRGMRAGGS